MQDTLVRILMSLQTWLAYICTMSMVGQEQGIYSTYVSENNHCYYLALINCSSGLPDLSIQCSQKITRLQGCLSLDSLSRGAIPPALQKRAGLSGHARRPHEGDSWPTIRCFMPLSPPSWPHCCSELAKAQNSQASASLQRKASRLCLPHWRRWERHKYCMITNQ
jgi:hypothetical protein